MEAKTQHSLQQRWSDFFRVWRIQIKAGWMEPSLCIRQHSERLDFKVRLNESVLKECDQQLTTGGINESAENDANLPPSVAKEGGQEHYQKIN